MIWLAVWLGCQASPAPAPVLAPAKQPERAPSSWSLELGPVLQGLCDASAGVWHGGTLYVADDERNVLHRFDGTGKRLGLIDLAEALPELAGGKEADIEGATLLGDTAWWVGSHDRGKGTAPRPDRQRLFGLKLSDEVAVPSGALQTDLLRIFAAQPELAAVLQATEGHTSKAIDGFSIEGLATGDEGLWVGLRAPVVDGRALMVPLTLAGDATAAGPPVWLELGGRGVRSLENYGDSLLVVAGPPADGGDFALYQWSDGAAERLNISLGSLRPEGLVATDDRLWLLSDDGGVEIRGQDCKKLPEGQRRARTAWLTAPADGDATAPPP